ncbi:hypothetical protein I3843_15G046200 [Carya illinoinensis]|nr:hypothetical protein I3843_15G046200 [Carya illinoinensis]
MDSPVLFLLLSLSFSLSFLSSSLDTIHESTSLSTEKLEDILISPNGVFSTFIPWSSRGKNQTVIWMANHDQPINGKSSKLSLLKTGNLILTDTGKFKVWATNTQSLCSVYLSLYNTGNLVLQNMKSVTLWESFDFLWSTYNNSRIIVLDTFENFSSSDDFTFMAADYGPKLHRRLKIDYDGDTWFVSWKAFQRPCKIYGICWANSLCSYIVGSDRKCSCLSRYKMKNLTDCSYGCEPVFHLSCNRNEIGFLLLPHVEFFGYDYGFFPNYTFDQSRSSNCYPRTLLLNGYRSPDLQGDLYLRLPKSNLFSYANSVRDFTLVCSSKGTVQLDNKTSRENGIVKFLLYIFLVWRLLSRTHQACSVDKQSYLVAVTGFKRFTYAELKKMTKDFNEEIGRGAGGIAYKGVLPDNRAVAIKHLNEPNQGEGEFLAKVSIIRRYCAEGKRRPLCLEWVSHCDVKPQNILINSNYRPKVADFGLSKLKNRNLKNSSFSRIRGTRGYMALESVFNLPITSKVDVYSYGIVVLEMVMGKGPTKVVHAIDSGGETEPKSLVAWLEEIVDPLLEGSYKMGKMETLVTIALQCVEEEKDARPSMSQVAEIVLRQENYSHSEDHGVNH